MCSSQSGDGVLLWQDVVCIVGTIICGRNSGNPVSFVTGYRKVLTRFWSWRDLRWWLLFLQSLPVGFSPRHHQPNHEQRDCQDDRRTCYRCTCKCSSDCSATGAFSTVSGSGICIERCVIIVVSSEDVLFLGWSSSN